ncbi:MAG: hypothetical protein WCT36_05025 [Candidatus Gracilibacteria bacterium]|jgi:hypothetical protein
MKLLEPWPTRYAERDSRLLQDKAQEFLADPKLHAFLSMEDATLGSDEGVELVKNFEYVREKLSKIGHEIGTILGERVAANNIVVIASVFHDKVFAQLPLGEEKADRMKILSYFIKKGSFAESFIASAGRTAVEIRLLQAAALTGFDQY